MLKIDSIETAMSKEDVVKFLTAAPSIGYSPGIIIVPRILEVISTWQKDQKNNLLTSKVVTDVPSLENILIGHNNQVRITKSEDGRRIPLVIIIKHPDICVTMPLADIEDLMLDTIIPDSIYTGENGTDVYSNPVYVSMRGGQIVEIFKHSNRGYDTRNYTGSKIYFVRIDYPPNSANGRHRYIGRIPGSCPLNLPQEIVDYNARILQLIAANPEFIKYLKPQSAAATPRLTEQPPVTRLPITPLGTPTDRLGPVHGDIDRVFGNGGKQEQPLERRIVKSPPARPYQPNTPTRPKSASDDGKDNLTPPRYNPKPKDQDRINKLLAEVSTTDHPAAPKKETKKYTCALYYDSNQPTHTVVIAEDEQSLVQLVRKISPYLSSSTGKQVEHSFPGKTTVKQDGLVGKYVVFKNARPNAIQGFNTDEFEATSSVKGIKVASSPYQIFEYRRNENQLMSSIGSCIRDYLPNHSFKEKSKR